MNLSVSKTPCKVLHQAWLSRVSRGSFKALEWLVTVDRTLAPDLRQWTLEFEGERFPVDCARLIEGEDGSIHYHVFARNF